MNPPEPRIGPPFRFFGSKWNVAKLYPYPLHTTIIEPFVGSAGYSLLWHDRNVILIEKDLIIASVWKYLINASPKEILKLPVFEYPDQTVEEIAKNWPQEVKWLIGFFCSIQQVAPRKKIVPALQKVFYKSSKQLTFWSEKRKIKLSELVRYIKHWQIIEGDYTEAPDIEATWFIDPPYQENRIRLYRYNLEDNMFKKLAQWCMNRKGQIIVYEQKGADWLPFKLFYEMRGGRTLQNRKIRKHTAMIWYKEHN